LSALRIHASLLKGVSVMISESTSTKFSLTISEWIGDMGADESARHLWKLFRWLFLSQQGLRALPNPRVAFSWCFGDDFHVSTDSVFVDHFFVNRGFESF
jgi:hypothetical protein